MTLAIDRLRAILREHVWHHETVTVNAADLRELLRELEAFAGQRLDAAEGSAWTQLRAAPGRS